MKLISKLQLIIGSIITLVLLILNFTIGEINIVSSYDVNLIILLPIAILTYFFLTYDLFIEAIEKIKEKDVFNEITLTIIATIAAFCILEFVEALAVVLFFKIGETFEDFAKDKSKNSLKAILELKPDYANLLINNKEKKVSPEELKINDVILIKPGEKIPVDGIIIEGSTTLNTSSITGESLPKDVNINDEVISGTINISNVIKVRVIKLSKDSTVTKILDMVTNSMQNKTKQEKFITKFSRIYTPIVIALAFFFALVPPLIIGLFSLNGESISSYSLWQNWINVGCSFLVISCPCSLVLSVPLTYFVAIGVCSKYKAIVKGTVYLEYLNSLNTLALDKTGTITKGNFEIQSIEVNKGIDTKDLLNYACIGEHYSSHPISLAIKEISNININENDISSYESINGKGVKTVYKNKVLLVGNESLLKDNNINYKVNENIGTIVYVAYDNEYLGSICIADSIKEDSKIALNELRKLGFKEIIMLTGDNFKNAAVIANDLNINYKANLLPTDKANIIDELKKDNKKVCFVGDGINDTVSLVKSDIGVSMGNIGSDAAIENSDIILMDDKLSTLVKVKKISKITKNKAIFNIVFSLIIKIGMMILSILNSSLSLNLNSAIMWFAIFADVGVTIICVLNSMSLMIKKIN